MNDKKQLFDYSAKLNTANEYAEKLLLTLKELDTVDMPDNITVSEIARFTYNIISLMSFIDKRLEV